MLMNNMHIKHKELKTSSKKTIDFYNKYQNIDFIQMNDILVDLLDKMLINIHGELTNSLTQELVDSIKIMGKEMISMKDSIEKSNKDVITNILLKLYEQKSEFISEMRILMDKSDTESILKIIDKMEKSQLQLITDIIPKSNTEYYQKYELMLKSFRDEIKNTDQIDILEKKHYDLTKDIEISLLNHLSKTEERIQHNMNDIKSMNIINTEMQKELSSTLSSHFNKYNNSSLKGQIAENHIEELLSCIYPSSNITKTVKESRSGDLILNRRNMEPILFEIKNYSSNVPINEINKFIRDINEHNMSGIMISISSGIANKNNFQIDITKNNNICIYVHNMNYDREILKLSIDIIDNLGPKLKQHKGDITISPETIEQINNEYQTFMLKRDMAISGVKELAKKSIQYIEEMELKTLNTYLASKFSFKNSSTLNCDICKNFIGTNLKSLAAHKRRCKLNKKHNDTGDIIDPEDDIIHDDDSDEKHILSSNCSDEDTTILNEPNNTVSKTYDGLPQPKVYELETKTTKLLIDKTVSEKKKNIKPSKKIQTKNKENEIEL